MTHITTALKLTIIITIFATFGGPRPIRRPVSRVTRVIRVFRRLTRSRLARHLRNLIYMLF